MQNNLAWTQLVSAWTRLGWCLDTAWSALGQALGEHVLGVLDALGVCMSLMSVESLASLRRPFDSYPPVNIRFGAAQANKFHFSDEQRIG